MSQWLLYLYNQNYCRRLVGEKEDRKELNLENWGDEGMSRQKTWVFVSKLEDTMRV